jgi:hypothetical protein
VIEGGKIGKFGFIKTETEPVPNNWREEFNGFSVERGGYMSQICGTQAN